MKVRTALFLMVFIALSAFAEDDSSKLSRFEKCLQSLGSIGGGRGELGRMAPWRGDGLMLRDSSLPGYYLFNPQGAFRAKFTQASPKHTGRGLIRAGGPEYDFYSRVLKMEIPLVKDGKAETQAEYSVDEVLVRADTGAQLISGVGSFLINGKDAAESVQKKHDIPLETLSFRDDLNPAYWGRLGAYLAKSLNEISLNDDELAPVTVETFHLRMKDHFQDCRAVGDFSLIEAADRLEKRLAKKYPEIAKKIEGEKVRSVRELIDSLPDRPQGQGAK
ncbi:MAG: hypothetical protein AB7P04_05110 [Bacteriovoracia bacterium]